MTILPPFRAPHPTMQGARNGRRRRAGANAPRPAASLSRRNFPAEQKAGGGPLGKDGLRTRKPVLRTSPRRRPHPAGRQAVRAAVAIQPRRVASGGFGRRGQRPPDPVRPAPDQEAVGGGFAPLRPHANWKEPSGERKFA